MRRFVREQSLSLFFLAIFLLALGGQAYAGWHVHNDDAAAHGDASISFLRYVTGSDFGNTVMENWQSEYLQFLLLMLVTVWLVQRGSPESKSPRKAGRESDREQQIGPHADSDSPYLARIGGAPTALYANSLLIAMIVIFAGSWFAQSVTGMTDFNAEQAEHGEAGVSWLGYVGSAAFWEATLENWQSEFLAVGSFAVLTIYLRQRGSPESKPVGASHDSTGVEG
jgi:hypothetical protein